MLKYPEWALVLNLASQPPRDLQPASQPPAHTHSRSRPAILARLGRMPIFLQSKPSQHLQRLLLRIQAVTRLRVYVACTIRTRGPSSCCTSLQCLLVRAPRRLLRRRLAWSTLFALEGSRFSEARRAKLIRMPLVRTHWLTQEE